LGWRLMENLEEDGRVIFLRGRGAVYWGRTRVKKKKVKGCTRRGGHSRCMSKRKKGDSAI